MNAIAMRGRKKKTMRKEDRSRPTKKKTMRKQSQNENYEKMNEHNNP